MFTETSVSQQNAGAADDLLCTTAGTECAENCEVRRKGGREGRSVVFIPPPHKFCHSAGKNHFATKAPQSRKYPGPGPRTVVSKRTRAVVCCAVNQTNREVSEQ